MDDLDNDIEPTGDEESFADLLEESLRQPTRLTPGQKIEGRVLKVTADWVFIDVGQKGEGVLDKKEFLQPDGTFDIEEGQTVTAYFLSAKGGEWRFTTRVGGADAGLAQLEDAFRGGIPVEGTVEREIKGGFEVRVAGGGRGFCPFSQLGLRPAESGEAAIGRQLLFRITRFEEKGRNLVLSHRAIVEEERRRQREALKETLQVGATVRGQVVSLRDFGAFVDIGGIEGLIPLSELAWGRVENVQEVLRVGQEVEVVVKSLDWEKDRFSLSLREAQADPWSGAAANFPTGSVHSGKVVRLAPFGAFVALADGVEGLVHISKLGAGKRISHPREVVREGETLAVQVESVDPQQRRMALVPAAGEAEAEGDLSQLPPPPKSMGSFADLLRAAQEKKGRKGR